MPGCNGLPSRAEFTVVLARRALTVALCAFGLHAAPVNAQSPQPEIQRKQFATSDGVRLSYIEAGQSVPGRPLIAFVPGWAMPAAVFLPQVQALARTHRVAALDPRGQGESEVPASGFSIGRRAEDVRDFLAHLTAQASGSRVLLAGWSLGALEAVHYVERNGEGLLAGLVLIDSSVGEDPVPAPGGSFLESLRRDRAAAVDGFVRGIFQRSRSEPELRALRDGALRMPLEASLSLFPSSVPRERWRNTVRGFSRPLLYTVTPQFTAQAGNLKRARPATQVEVFATAGHALFADEPERFNALLAVFANSLALSTTEKAKP